MFLMWLFLKFLHNYLNTQEPGKENFSSQKLIHGALHSDSPWKNVLSKSCPDYILFLNFKKVCGENVVPYKSSVFGVFAHTVISVVSFVIQMMVLRTKMEKNKVKNSKNIKQILFFPLVIQPALDCTYIGRQRSTQCVSGPYLQLSPQSHLTFLRLTTFSSCCNKT